MNLIYAEQVRRMIDSAARGVKLFIFLVSQEGEMMLICEIKREEVAKHGANFRVNWSTLLCNFFLLTSSLPAF